MRKFLIVLALAAVLVPVLSFPAFAETYDLDPIALNPTIYIDDNGSLAFISSYNTLFSDYFYNLSEYNSDFILDNWYNNPFVWSRGSSLPRYSFTLNVQPGALNDYSHILYGSFENPEFNDVSTGLCVVPLCYRLSLTPDSNFDGYINIKIRYNTVAMESVDYYIDYFADQIGWCNVYTSTSPTISLPRNDVYSPTNISVLRSFESASSSFNANRYNYFIDTTINLNFKDFIGGTSVDSTDYVFVVFNVPLPLTRVNRDWSFFVSVDSPSTFELFDIGSNYQPSLDYIQNQLNSLSIINEQLLSLLQNIQSSDLNTIISSLSDIYSSLDHLDYIVMYNIYPAIDQIEAILNTSVLNESTIISLLYDLKTSIGNQNTELIHYFNTVDPADQDSLDNFDDSVSNLGNTVGDYNDAQAEVDKIVSNVTLPTVTLASPDVMDDIGLGEFSQNNDIWNSYTVGMVVVAFSFATISLILYGKKGSGS